MRAGISSENSSMRRSGIAAALKVTAGSRRQRACHAPTGSGGARFAFAIRPRGAADQHRVARKTELARLVGGGVEGLLFGGEGGRLIRRHHDRPPALVRNDVVIERRHRVTLSLVP